MNQSVILKDLVLVGGGHAHVHVVKMLAMKPVPGVRITVISRETDSPYSGMLPGFVAGIYTHDECHLDLRKITSFASARFIHAEVCGIDVVKKLIKFTDPARPPMSYDVVSINIGITPKLGSSSWNQDKSSTSAMNITPVKPIDGFARRWDEIIARVVHTVQGSIQSPSPFQLAMVGAGAGGVELCLAIYSRLRKEVQQLGVDPSFLSFVIVNRGPHIMANHNKAVRKIMLRILNEKGITVRNNCDVQKVVSTESGQSLSCASGESISFDEAIWCTQASPQAWLKDTGLSLDTEGFINIQPTLESTNTPDVFAAGDICCMVNNPCLKAGVFAVRAGPPLVANLRRRLKGESPLEEWVPQQQFLGIIGTGDEYAIASRGPLALEGEYLWTLKDNIDRVWMQGYQELPVMDMTKKRRKKKDEELDDHDNEDEDEDEEDYESDDEKTEQLAHAMGQEAIDLLTHSKMRCGGCGSKVGAQVLDRALRRVQHLINPRSEVVAGLGVSKGDDAALVRLPNKPNMLLVHTLDYFRSFVSDPFIFGRIAANHSLSDIHAMNGDAVTCLALCVIPYGPEVKVEESLVQMLAGLCSFLKDENCSLVGGHTSEGGDSALGLAVNGVVEEGTELRKGPPQNGDVLILTKPLGTGTILAADMRASAKGSWVQGALNSMQVSNRRAAAIFGNYECHGCTDVTGFGLMGHLLEMMKHTHDSDDKLEHSVLLDDDVCRRKPKNVDVCSVVIKMDDVPLLDGARQCVAAGVFSSLHPSNIRCARAVENPEDGKGSLVYPLLFDPQTAGGLLASVPARCAPDVLAALHAAGYSQAAAIGTFSDSASYEPSIRVE